MKRQNQMSEDNFVIEQESPKGPSYLLPSQRIINLQNQVIFYEGQVDPLQMQNFNLKENVVKLSRQVSFNTEILRGLLPYGNDPVKKYKLEMASFTQVTQFIDQTWKQMKDQLAALTQSQSGLKKQLQTCRQNLKQQHAFRLQQKLLYQSQYLQNQYKYKSEISSLQAQMAEAESQANILHSKFQQQINSKEKMIKKYLKQLQFSRHDFNSRSKQYESTINRLKNNIQAFLRQSQQAKISLKAFYEKMSKDKLAEQGQTYEQMLRIKQEEKRLIIFDMDDLRAQQVKELNQREEIANKLREELQQQKMIVMQIENELYQKREEMKGFRGQTKQMQDQIIILRQNCTIFQTNIKNKENMILQLEDKLSSTINAYDNRISRMEQAQIRHNNQMTKEKNILLSIVNSLQTQLKQNKIRISKIQEQFQAKNKSQIDTYKANELELMKIIQKQQNDIKIEKDEVHRIQQQKQEQVKRWKQHYQQVVKKMEKDFQKQKQAYIKQQIVKAAKESSKFEQQQINLSLLCKMEIQSAKQKNQQQIARIRQEFLNKANQKELVFQRQKRQYEQKIQILLSEKNVLNEQIGKLNKKMQQWQEKTQKMKANHIRQITKLQQKNNQTILTWQNTLQNQLNQFQKVMMEKQMKIGEMEDHMQREKEQINLKMQNKQKQVAQAKVNLQKQIKQFKKKSGIDEIQTRFENDVKNIKAASLVRQRQQYLSFVKQKSLMIEDHTRDKNNLVAFYTKQLNQLSKTLQQALTNITILLLKVTHNDDFKQQQSRKELSLLNYPAKIQNIEKQIKSIQSLLFDKKSELISVKDKLQRIERSIEQALVQRKQEIQRERIAIVNQMQTKLQETLKQYYLTAAKKQAQYRLKEAQLEKQRIGFVQLLHQEFRNLRDSHQKDYSKLLQKYIEMEHNFQNRPSRGEDIAKIKELTLKNNKLNRQVQTLQKRYETANQIVKYLNLELQNYKEMYDIFKPTQVPNKTISFNFDSQKAEKYNRIIKKLRDQHNRTLAKRNHFSVDITPFFQERINESLDKNGRKIVKESQLQVKAERSEGQQQLALQSKESQQKMKKHSFVPLRNRLKTEVSPNRQSQIFQNTQTFLKLANVQVNSHFPQQLQIQKKQSYRRRKIKRLATGIESFI